MVTAIANFNFMSIQKLSSYLNLRKKVYRKLIIARWFAEGKGKCRYYERKVMLAEGAGFYASYNAPFLFRTTVTVFIIIFMSSVKRHRSRY